MINKATPAGNMEMDGWYLLVKWRQVYVKDKKGTSTEHRMEKGGEEGMA